MGITLYYTHFRLIITLAILLFSQHIFATNSVLIWPLNPVIESQDKTSAIWLQNNGKKPVVLQIRVLKWQQKAAENHYDEQKEVVISPPMAEIQPGKKQFVRLIKQTTLPDQTEYAYRIFVDEIPQANEAGDTEEVTMGIKFQMRYSIPLFLQGKNIWTNQNYKQQRDIKTATQAALSYQIKNNAGKRWLEIQNKGQVHARISNIYFRDGGKKSNVNGGLLGYVLPGNTMQFPLSAQTKTGGTLEAKINEMIDPIIIPKSSF